MQSTAKEIIHRVQPNVGRAATTRNETSPPPVVVLGAELEVGQNDGDLDASDNKDDEDEQQEPEDVVVAVEPDSGEDEEELEEDSAEGEDAGEGDRGVGLHVPRLIRNMARNSSRCDRNGDGFRAISENSADEHERNGDEEPQADDGDHRQEWDGTRGTLRPDGKIDDEECCECDTGNEGAGHQDVHPRRAVPQFEQASRSVPAVDTQEDEEDEEGGEESATVRRSEESQGGDDDDRDGHSGELSAATDEGGEHLGILRSTEDILTNKFPTGLIGEIFVDGLDSVVGGDVTIENTHHDNGDHNGQEDDDQGGVDDGKPVDFVVSGVQVDVPTSRPQFFCLLPGDAPGEANAGLLGVGDGERSEVLVCEVGVVEAGLAELIGVVLDGHWVSDEGDDAFQNGFLVSFLGVNSGDLLVALLLLHGGVVALALTA